ncbi:hypothetical protein C1J03_10070 [Sulfitobacter sp. SK012]|uniref:hypothetical protein n=1 Tax=Sulfitobacter sp. SK012 TaxID=1389005 RepID=UPI000E0BF97C|nr:hypothetical protein [Sulfitobacter sp. SK012]AXI46339.1 hypothetical protein C1J03_10070 [Sulfitobacter sp. SK012]
MGDFQDVFGAGADADDIIDGYSREYERSSRSEKANWNGASSDVGSKEQRHNDSWSSAMAAKGYTQGPHFSSYDELSAWDSSNARSHVRSRNDQGYQIYFTDGQPQGGSESKVAPDSRKPTPSTDDDIPF